ncbi:MAG: hypothetical protein L6455_15420, partial [Kiritimatiellae bacterium]|nr:hypothetical protein [Kiritimatiellia bacterium]
CWVLRCSSARLERLQFRQTLIEVLRPARINRILPFVTQKRHVLNHAQVSDINSLTTRHDLRPRPVSTCSPNYACFVIGFQTMNSLTSDDMEYFGAQSLHLRYG